MNGREEAPLRIFALAGQKGSDLRFVVAVRNCRVRENLPGVRAEADERADAGIVEGLDAERVDRTEEEMTAGVPEGEGEVSEQVIRAGCSPFEIGREEQSGIRSFGAFSRREPDDQVRAVVEAAVEQGADLPVGIEEGLLQAAAFFRME